MILGEFIHSSNMIGTLAPEYNIITTLDADSPD